jgi:hypothetical protein
MIAQKPLKNNEKTMINIGGMKRDLLLLGSLVLMVKVAMDRQKTDVIAPVLYAPAKQSAVFKTVTPLEPDPASIVVTTAPLAVEAPLEMPQSPAPFEVHEANADIVQQIETAQTQINQLLALVKPTTKHAAQLKSMQQRLTQLKKEYKNTSPAIALLGPIGTAGIVLKENELEKSLLRMVNLTRSILQTLANIDEEKPSYKSIAQGLEQNAQLIASLSKGSTTA